MERPRVVMSVGASVDGKIALTRQQTLMQQPSGQLWAEIAPAYADRMYAGALDLAHPSNRGQAVLEGSGSLVPDGSVPEPLPPRGEDPAGVYTDYLPPAVTDAVSAHTWFTVVDGRGRIRWTERNEGWEILVLTCRSTPVDYLSYLRREQICYLVAGEERVDLAAALHTMATRLGISRLTSTAGGELNATLVRAGLVDEVSVTVLPALVGGRDTPTVLDGVSLPVGVAPTSLRLLSVHTDTGGIVRLRYEVVHSPDAA